MISTSFPSCGYDMIMVLFCISNLVEDGFERTIALPADLRDAAMIDATFNVAEGCLLGLTSDMDVSRSVCATPPAVVLNSDR